MNIVHKQYISEPSPVFHVKDETFLAVKKAKLLGVVLILDAHFTMMAHFKKMTTGGTRGICHSVAYICFGPSQLSLWHMYVAYI